MPPIRHGDEVVYVGVARGKVDDRKFFEIPRPRELLTCPKCMTAYEHFKLYLDVRGVKLLDATAICGACKWQGGRTLEQRSFYRDLFKAFKKSTADKVKGIPQTHEDPGRSVQGSTSATTFTSLTLASPVPMTSAASHATTPTLTFASASPPVASPASSWATTATSATSAASAPVTTSANAEVNTENYELGATTIDVDHKAGPDSALDAEFELDPHDASQPVMTEDVAKARDRCAQPVTGTHHDGAAANHGVDRGNQVSHRGGTNAFKANRIDAATGIGATARGHQRTKTGRGRGIPILHPAEVQASHEGHGYMYAPMYTDGGVPASSNASAAQHYATNAPSNSSERLPNSSSSLSGEATMRHLNAVAGPSSVSPSGSGPAFAAHIETEAAAGAGSEAAHIGPMPSYEALQVEIKVLRKVSADWQTQCNEEKRRADKAEEVVQRLQDMLGFEPNHYEGESAQEDEIITNQCDDLMHREASDTTAELKAAEWRVAKLETPEVALPEAGAQVAKLQDKVAKQDALIAKLQDKVAERDALIDRQSIEMARKDEMIAHQTTEVARKDAERGIAENGLECASLMETYIVTWLPFETVQLIRGQLGTSSPLDSRMRDFLAEWEELYEKVSEPVRPCAAAPPGALPVPELNHAQMEVFREMLNHKYAQAEELQAQVRQRLRSLAPRLQADEGPHPGQHAHVATPVRPPVQQVLGWPPKPGEHNAQHQLPQQQWQQWQQPQMPQAYTTAPFPFRHASPAQMPTMARALPAHQHFHPQQAQATAAFPVRHAQPAQTTVWYRPPPSPQYQHMYPPGHTQQHHAPPQYVHQHNAHQPNMIHPGPRNMNTNANRSQNGNTLQLQLFPGHYA